VPYPFEVTPEEIAAAPGAYVDSVFSCPESEFLLLPKGPGFMVGDSIESAIEDALTAAGVSYRKTRRAERVPGFDQAPDFIVPDEFRCVAVIEAKYTEDDGTARDKVTRVQHLAALAREGCPASKRRFQVVACIGGAGSGCGGRT
jgi:hypothetical protein